MNNIDSHLTFILTISNSHYLRGPALKILRIFIHSQSHSLLINYTHESSPQNPLPLNQRTLPTQTLSAGLLP